MIILSIIVFIIILGVLVLAHEFGHFITAKKAGMKVEEFGIGFPPRLFSWKRGETVYSINLVPLGGFVKIMGENNDSENDPRSFINKPFWPRFLTLIAGVLMNIILAWVLISVGFGLGLPTEVMPGDVIPAHSSISSPAITILDVSPGSPASQAGMQEGDQIININGQVFTDINALVNYVHSQEGHNLKFEIKRGNQLLDLSAQARTNFAADQGSVGIALGEVGRLKYVWYYAPVAGAQATWTVGEETVLAFYQLIVQHQGLSQLGGPIKIASMTNQVTKLGLVYIIQFAALLSVNLAILNVLPFPALDGGRILFLIIEKIRRKRNNPNVEGWVNAVGFGLLILLVIIISVHDVQGLIKK